MKNLTRGLFALIAVCVFQACGGAQHADSTPTATVSPAPEARPVARAVPAAALHAILRANRIEIDQMIEFDENSDHITPASNVILDQIIQVLQQHAEIHLLRVEGHTDNLGTAARNQQLSVQRAAAVAQYLRDHGVTIRIETSGVGATEPLCSENTPECRARNRRVDFVVDGGDAGA